MPFTARVLIALFTLTAAGAALGAYENAQAAQTAVLEDVGAMTPDERAEAKSLLAVRTKAAPKNIDALHAFVKVCQATNDWDSGLPAARKLEELAPDVAEHQYLLGNALFSTIDQVSMFNKGARASAGRKAYQRAVELEPKHLGARIGLANFYLQAPGFAGGSKKKAEEIARQLASEPEHAREGYSLLLQITAAKGDWAAYNDVLTESLEASETREEREMILRVATYNALTERKDYGRALALARQYREVQDEGSYYADYFEGVALHELEQYEAAAERFEAVIAIEPDAKNTRYRIAECYEEIDKDAEAAKHYAAFAERFPEDDRAKKAARKADRLAG